MINARSWSGVFLTGFFADYFWKNRENDMKKVSKYVRWIVEYGLLSIKFMG